MTYRPDNEPPQDIREQVFQAKGEVARLAREKDWSATPLGPVDSWPVSLRAAVGLVMAAPAAMIVLWGPELVQVYNDGYREVMGAKHPGGLGQPTRECWPEVWHFNAPLYEAVLKRRETFTFERQHLVLERDGHPEEAFFALSYSPLSDDAGRTAGVLVTVTETSAEVQRESAEERLHMALEAADLGTWDLDLLSGESSVRSLRHDQIFGYREQQPTWGWEVAMRHVLEEDRPACEEAFRRATETGSLFFTARVRWPDGSLRWIEVVGRTYFDAQGRPVRMAGVVADTTERSQAEALRESEERYRNLFESIEQGFCVMEMVLDQAGQAIDYRFVETNPAFARHTGLADAAGRTARELIPGLEDHWVRAYGRVAATGEPLRFVEYSAAMGRWFEVEAFRTGKPRAHRVALLFTDITERKRAEEALRENDRRKDEFLAMLAHELRNPLAAIGNAVSLLERRSSDPGMRRYLEMVTRQTAMLRGLVDDLLDVSRITRGLIELKRERVDFAAITGNALGSVQAQMDDKRHKVSLVLPPGGAPVLGDAVRLEQVVVNLLTNAAKYTDPGGHVEVRLERCAGDLQVRLRVRDSGIGMEADVRERIFDLFDQAERGLARSEGGLGIGLTIVRNLVERHGGTIEARSEGLGKGSEFVVTLPMAPPERDQAAQPAAGPPIQKQQRSTPMNPKTILVVDDGVDIAETLSMLLEDSGHRVYVAHDGPSALAKADEVRPELVLLDIGLPGMDGYEVAQRLRQNPHMRGAVLAALTGYGQPADQDRAAAAGFDRHFTKPVDIDALERFVNEPRAAGGH